MPALMFSGYILESISRVTALIITCDNILLLSGLTVQSLVVGNIVLSYLYEFGILFMILFQTVESFGISSAVIFLIVTYDNASQPASGVTISSYSKLALAFLLDCKFIGYASERVPSIRLPFISTNFDPTKTLSAVAVTPDTSA